MDKKTNLDFTTNNLAVPEITIDGNVDVSDEEKDDILFENVAFPEIHIKAHNTPKNTD